jgi:4-amino-4-deoxy-L-arabinose transferase-like glycosyltransferase
LILYAPGLASIPPVDRDEARFAHATRQMLESGDIIPIRFQDEARNKKPIGIRWLQAAVVALFSSPGSAFRKSLARRGLNLSAVDRVSGLDYSASGGRVILILYDLESR